MVEVGVSLDRLRDDLLQCVAAFDVETISGADALGLLRVATEVESIASSLKLSLARRVETTNQHQCLGYRSASDLVAAKTGLSGVEANSALATARRLEELPATRSQFSSGQLSVSQASEVARGAAADPSAEAALLERARLDSNEALRRERGRIEAQRLPSLESRRKRRRFCWKPGAPGLTEFWGTVANEDFAFLKAGLDQRAKKFFTAARKAKAHEPQSAYLADALVDLASSGGSSKAQVNINVVVDHETLAAASGDASANASGVCEIPGFGPISPETAKAWSNDCWLNVLLRKAKDVTTIASERRYVPVDVRRSLGIKDPVCSIRGCEQSVGLELDHRDELQDGGLTQLDNLGLLCRHHHKLKTHNGFGLQGKAGDYTLIPPKDHSQDRLFPPGET